MSKLELLEAFFSAYEALNALPKKKGAPDAERKAATELLQMRADAVRRGAPAQVQATVNPDVAAYRALRAQVAAIAPKDTRGTGKGPASVVHG